MEPNGVNEQEVPDRQQEGASCHSPQTKVRSPGDGATEERGASTAAIPSEPGEALYVEAAGLVYCLSVATFGICWA